MPQLDAIGVTVTDMARSVSFYRLLGLPIAEGAETEGHTEVALPTGMRLMFDTIEVVRSFRDFEPGDGDRSVAFAFRCADPAEVDATFRRLTDAGHRAEVAPFDAVWGQRYATVLDPDGNPVDLYAPLEA
ncbi:MAG: glyoxalase [Actinobacteria bacterium]|nr:glyoxalase [Actinomycetota bacterium]NIS35020.1 glyoxalase [Actinomycetota bacterium]NIU69744.1 glyoxalase [Actinomycetota bacterium]NIV89583.1 glyoxalase [Actinomycetota bacterium]NIW31620.1 glyoxalase [Actinomycetota bacterium]